MIRNISLIICGVLMVGALFAQQSEHKENNVNASGYTAMFRTNRCFAKAGLGIVNKKLYILLRLVANGKNGLIVKPTEETEQRWTGKDASNAEVVIFYGGKICPADDLPKGFDLSRTVVISFEIDKVRFFDFDTMSGGYYERTKKNDNQ